MATLLNGKMPSTHISGPTRRQRLFRRFMRHRPALISLAFLVILSIIAAAAPWITAALGLDPFEADLFQRLKPPSGAHPLGTDEAGRDLLARLIHGARTSLAVGLATAIFAAAIGTAIGLAAGYRGGLWDALLMRFTDGVISLPLLPLLIVLAALDLSKLGLPPDLAASSDIAIWRIIVIIALVSWTTVARLVRAETLSMRRREFVVAARAQGAPPFYIVRTHILPNVAAPIVVATTLSIGNVILLESVLSFLGLGIQPPTPSWGNMLNNAQELIWRHPEQAIWPGLMIFLTVIAFNFLGDGLQDTMDPKALEEAAKDGGETHEDTAEAGKPE